MTSREAYNRFLLKVNKSDTNSEIAILISAFVLLYNTESLRWLSDKLKLKESTDSIDDISELLITDETLLLNSINKNYNEFKLLDNYFRYVSSYSLAKKNDCKKNIFNFKIKPKNRNVYLQDEFSKLSFEWEETFVELSDNNLLVFKDNFEIEEAKLDYYKKLNKINIAGYYDSNNVLTIDVDLEIDNMWVNEILDRCAAEIIRQYENLDGFELAVDRINRE